MSNITQGEFLEDIRKYFMKEFGTDEAIEKLSYLDAPAYNSLIMVETVKYIYNKYIDDKETTS